MMISNIKYTFCLLIMILSVKNVLSIFCYQCSGTNSSDPFECNEYLDSDTNLVPTDCAAIHDAQFCIKQFGRYEGNGIACYQCNSSSAMECGDGLMNLDNGILEAVPCDHVYDARFCIKQIGGISTKRYCSSLDLGNYCNYVGQPGDKLEYRTCTYTCSTDGCNSASSLSISFVMFVLVLPLLKCLY